MLSYIYMYIHVHSHACTDLFKVFVYMASDLYVSHVYRIPIIIFLSAYDLC